MSKFYALVSFFIKTGDALAEEDILSSHTVHFKVECSLKCLQSSTCGGYNYRAKSNRYAVNCQLSNKTRTRDQGAGAKEKWMFYQDLEKVKKTGLELKCERDMSAWKQFLCKKSFNFLSKLLAKFDKDHILTKTNSQKLISKAAG